MLMYDRCVGISACRQERVGMHCRLEMVRMHSYPDRSQTCTGDSPVTCICTLRRLARHVEVSMDVTGESLKTSRLSDTLLTISE